MFNRIIPSSTRRLQNHSLLVLAMAASFSGITSQAMAQEDASPMVGSWKWMRSDGDDHVRCNLHVTEEDGKLIATFTDKKETKAKVAELKFEDDTLQFTLQMEDAKAQFKGELKKNRVTGKMKWGDDVTDWKADRFVSLAEAVATWKLEFTTPDGMTRTPEIKVSEKDGEPEVEFGEGHDSEASDGEITNVKFEDGVLTFDVALEFNGSELRLEYDLELNGDELDGTMFFEIAGGPTGDVDVIGERAK